MIFLLRSEAGKLFLRTFFGYRSEPEARAVEKALWRESHAVRVEKGWWRWHVWRSV